MTNLFKKAAVFTDLHLGHKNNSEQHNQDCIDFIEWFIQTAKKEGCETCFFLGDWNHNRATINIQTLHYSLKGLELLSKAFDHVYFIAGNHDLYHKSSRDIHSVEWAKHLPNVTIVTDWIEEGNVVIAPWLVNEDWRDLQKKKGKYLMGHFELPHFILNAMIAMPDHGELQTSHVAQFDYVFSGHFHKRQAKHNVWYIGNAFPHNYSDAGDDARGMMILEWGCDPEFHSWPSQPKFRIFNISDIITDAEKLLLPKSSCRVHLDVDISYEEANYIRETLIPQYNLREMALVPSKNTELGEQEATELKFEGVDNIVSHEIGCIQSDFYDKAKLLEIYRSI
ncbi:putative non-transporter ABC protein [Daphnia sinensis]|uniref:Non-transporter ABC protein n=1 Tax=Daphnia sinensis TaxID=1820382 RepID=A0AAD5KSP3_9CRUS|nr:putative non-transporter ABC protein [Daphnia sinensis]